MSPKLRNPHLSLLFIMVTTSMACTSARPTAVPSQASVAVSPKVSAHLPTPDRFPPLAREILHRRMLRHGDDMLSLVSSVLMLNHQGVEALATEIVREPRLGRPTPADPDTLNVQLPPRFFVLQDELKDRARTVASAAHAQDNEKVVKSFGQLVETCVSCHAVYLDEAMPMPDDSDTAKLQPSPTPQTLHQP